MSRQTMIIHRFVELNQVFRKKGKEGAIPFDFFNYFNLETFIDRLSTFSIAYFFIPQKNTNLFQFIALVFEGYFFTQLIQLS